MGNVPEAAELGTPGYNGQIVGSKWCPFQCSLFAQCDEKIVQLGGNHIVAAVVHCRKASFRVFNCD